MSPIPLGILASSGAGALPAYELISTQILGTAAASVTFSSIPQTYKHLQIRLSVTNTAVNAVSYPALRFNGDATAVYSIHSLDGGYPNGVQGQASLGRSEMVFGRFLDSYSNYGNYFGAAIIDVLDYASTAKNKTIRAFGGAVAGANQDAQLRLSSGMWPNTAAISSLTFVHWVYGGNFAAGSRISIYGIKGV